MKKLRYQRKINKTVLSPGGTPNEAAKLNKLYAKLPLGKWQTNKVSKWQRESQLAAGENKCWAFEELRF